MAPILVMVVIMGTTPALAGAGNGNQNNQNRQHNQNGQNNQNANQNNRGGVHNNNDIIPIPEPTTILLVGSGLVGLAGLVVYRKRRMKK